MRFIAVSNSNFLQYTMTSPQLLFEAERGFSPSQKHEGGRGLGLYFSQLRIAIVIYNYFLNAT